MQGNMGKSDKISAAELFSNMDSVEAKSSGDIGKLFDATQAEVIDHLVSPSLVATILRLVEVLLIFSLGIVSLYLINNSFDWTVLFKYLLPVVIVAITFLIIATSMRLYETTSMLFFTSLLWREILVWLLIGSGIFVVGIISNMDRHYDYRWFIIWFTLSFVSVILARFLLSMLMQQWNANGRFDRRAVIVGAGKMGEELIKALENSSNSDIKIVGVFDDRDPERVGKSVLGYPVLGTIDELVRYSRKKRVDMLIVTLPIKAEDRLLQILQKLWVLPINIHLSTHTHKIKFSPKAYSYIGDVPVLDVIEKPVTGKDYIVKTIEDKIIATIALIFLSPVMLAVAIAVKLSSPGPIIFRQKRYGFNNELIEVFKFRSMYIDKLDYTASKGVKRGDPRVTKVGKFIRKTSLDELPQLFNVLKGDLALVGPRPHAMQARVKDDKLYMDVIDSYFARHKVKPGITGWAQINGWRGDVDNNEKIQKRIEHDLYYIENWSLKFDLYILLKTPISLLNTENAF